MTLSFHPSLKKLGCIITTLALSGCSLYPFHSNVDKQNFTEYFKSARIQVLTKEQLLDHNFQYLGTLEGSSCQAKSNEPPANESDARIDLVHQAADMPKANAVVFSSCVAFPKDKVCQSSVSCYGKAVQLLDTNK